MCIPNIKRERTVMFDNVVKYLDYAMKEKLGIFSAEPEVPKKSQDEEVYIIQTEFRQVVEKELERIELLAITENDRVMSLLRKNDAVTECPICLEDLSAINKGDETPLLATCCGTSYHWSCAKDLMVRRKLDSSNPLVCAVCRGDIIDNIGNLATRGGTAGKAHAMATLGDHYTRGKNGKKKNIKKALKYWNKAVELGSSFAKVKLAAAYYYGELNGSDFPKEPEKALDLVQEAVNQGDDNAQHLLGKILQGRAEERDSDLMYNTLYSVSAYQGNVKSLETLSMMNNEEYYRIVDEEGLSTEANYNKAREHVILGLYWCGKSTEKKLETGINAKYWLPFVGIFDTTMKMLFHDRKCFDLEPFTGYSHVPFTTFMLKRNDEETASYRKLFPYNDGWKHICVNCGKREENLKACARCRAFRYCSKKCQVKHWKDGHKVDCKGHWMESYFPKIREYLQE